LTNNTLAYEITRKPLAVQLRDTPADNKISVSGKTYSTQNELLNYLEGLIEYDGFATDTLTQETDNAVNSLNGKPRITITKQDGDAQAPVLRSDAIAAVSELIENYLVKIEIDNVTSNNYALQPQNNTNLSVRTLILAEMASINGNPRIGQTLTATIPGEGLDLIGGSIRYEWYVNDLLITDNNAPTYLVKDADLGKNVRIEITSSVASGRATSIMKIEGETPITVAEKSDDTHGIKFAKNIVSEKAEMNIILPNNERITEAKIVIYDMTGNIVFVGANLRVYPIIWNLTNNNGRNVANGTYLVVAEVRGQSGKVYLYSTKLGVKR
jgi:hypothetical protein